MKNQNSSDKLFLILSLLLAASALATVFPYPGAAEKCILGYKSFCSFNPVSTLLLAFASRTLFTIRKRRMQRAQN